MDPRYAGGAGALLEEDAVNPSLLMHGRQAQGMGGQPAGPPLVNPQAQAQPPMAMPRPAAPLMPGVPPGGPSARPPMPQGAAALEAPAPRQPAQRPQPGGQPSAARQQVSPEQLHDAMKNMLKSKYDEMGVQVDDARLKELTDFAVAKRQGRLAKQMGKKSKAALAKYFGAMVARDSAENAFAEHSQRLQSDIAAAIADGDEQKQMHFRDQLAAAKTHMEGKRELASGYRKVIEKRYKVDPRYLENPVSLFAFINDDADDDFNDVMGDDDPQP